jgi:hypothetical protein
MPMLGPVSDAGLVQSLGKCFRKLLVYVMLDVVERGYQSICKNKPRRVVLYNA